MKESIQQAGREVSIVIYDAPMPPKYFRFSKKFIRTLFVIVPLLLGLLLLGLFLWGVFTRLEEAPRPSFTNVLSEQDSKVLALETEVRALQESNAQLTEKLASQPSVPTAEDPFLLAIKRPYGMQNLLAENRVTLDNFELVQEPNNTGLKFNIISSTPENRVSGHVLVFMISGQGMTAWPPEANAALTSGIKYSLGDSFAVSRLRPTKAEFMQDLSGQSVKFIIYIFSREGDLLLVKETESYKLEPKQ